MHSGVCIEKPGVMQSIHLHLYRDPCRLRDTRSWQTHGTVCGPRNSKLREKKEQRVLQEQLMAQYCELFCLTSLWRPFDHKICFFKKKNICIHKKVLTIQVSDKQLRDRRRHKEECTCPLSQTNASRQTDWNACVHPHSHPLKKCFCSSRLFTSCWGWYQLYHCLPLKWDPPIPKCHSAWHGWHDIWRCYQVSDSGIYIWTLSLIWRGGEQKCGHLWQLARELTPSPSLTLCTQQYFSLALFEILHSFFFIHSHTICLLRSLSSCLLAHVHYCALPLSYMCGFVCNSARKATQLPDNLTSIG